MEATRQDLGGLALASADEDDKKDALPSGDASSEAPSSGHATRGRARGGRAGPATELWGRLCSRDVPPNRPLPQRAEVGSRHSPLVNDRETKRPSWIMRDLINSRSN